MQFTINFKEVKDAPVQIRSDHNTGDYIPYSYRTVSGFFNVPYYLISNQGYETGPPVYSPYPRRLESLTICRCNYKGSTFSSVILRPWVLVRPESNSRPPAWQPGAQPTEPPVRDWICNFFFPDAFCPHVSVEFAGKSGTFLIRSPEWIFFNLLWIWNRMDAKSRKFSTWIT